MLTTIVLCYLTLLHYLIKIILTVLIYQQPFGRCVTKWLRKLIIILGLKKARVAGKVLNKIFTNRFTSDDERGFLVCFSINDNLLGPLIRMMKTFYLAIKQTILYCFQSVPMLLSGTGVIAVCNPRITVWYKLQENFSVVVWYLVWAKGWGIIFGCSAWETWEACVRKHACLAVNALFWMNGSYTPSTYCKDFLVKIN